MPAKHPTPYKDINLILDILLTKAKEILNDQFVGMYLYGSLASGDFSLETSDIDFLIVIKDVLPETMVADLETMHNRIWKIKSKWASKLEGSYVHQELIRVHDPDGAPCPTVNEGKFFVDKRGSDWIIQRHVIRECGVVLEGPGPKILIDFVSLDDIRNAVMDTLNDWWFSILEDPPWLKKRGTEYQAYAVISMCRALHALEHGKIVSKPKAAQWAQKILGEPWEGLIDKAVNAQSIEESALFLEETLSFIRFVKEKVN